MSECDCLTNGASKPIREYLEHWTNCIVPNEEKLKGHFEV